jgi:hypothetical protein
LTSRLSAAIALGLDNCSYDGLGASCKCELPGPMIANHAYVAFGYVVIDYSDTSLCLTKLFTQQFTFEDDIVTKCFEGLGYLRKSTPGHSKMLETALREILQEPTVYQKYLTTVMILGDHSFDAELRALVFKVFGKWIWVLPQSSQNGLFRFAAAMGTAFVARREVGYQNEYLPEVWNCPEEVIVYNISSPWESDFLTGDSRKEHL